MVLGAVVGGPEIPATGANVVIKNVAGLYAKPDRSSEQVSQALLGQVVHGMETAPGWLRVKTPDGYTGWIEMRWLVDDQRGRSYGVSGLVARVANLFADLYLWPDPASDIITKTVVGMELEIAETRDDWVIVRLPDGSPGALRRFAVKPTDKAVHPLPLTPMGWELAATARRFMGVPYLWGGVSPFGLDCSGFVQLVYKLHDILLPRDAYMQAEDKRFIDITPDALMPGDLIFFGGLTSSITDRQITHTGISLGAGKFIHSCGGAGVCITQLDDPHYSSIFRLARRLL